MFERERLYQRAVSEWIRTSRQRGWPTLSPDFHRSEVRNNRVILSDEFGRLAVFRLQGNGKLQLVNHAELDCTNGDASI